MARDRLSPRESAFVKNRLTGMNGTAAAEAAGYAPGSARVSAYQLMQRGRVQDALREGAEARLKCEVPIAAAILVELATTSPSHDVRLRAAQAILDRGGLQLVRQSEHRHVVEDRRSDAELKAAIIQMSKELSLPIPPAILDADFAEIKPPTLPAPAPDPVQVPLRAEPAPEIGHNAVVVEPVAERHFPRRRPPKPAPSPPIAYDSVFED